MRLASKIGGLSPIRCRKTHLDAASASPWWSRSSGSLRPDRTLSWRSGRRRGGTPVPVGSWDAGGSTRPAVKGWRLVAVEGGTSRRSVGCGPRLVVVVDLMEPPIEGRRALELLVGADGV